MNRTIALSLPLCLALATAAAAAPDGTYWMETPTRKVKIHLEDDRVAGEWIFEKPEAEAGSELTGYKDFRFGSSVEEVRKELAPAELKSVEEAFGKKISATLAEGIEGHVRDGTIPFLGGEAILGFYFTDEGLGEVRIIRTLDLDEKLEDEPFFERKRALFEEKYGSPDVNGLTIFEAMETRERIKHNRDSFLFAAWNRTGGRIMLSLSGGNLVVAYQSDTYTAFSEAAQKRKALSEI